MTIAQVPINTAKVFLFYDAAYVNTAEEQSLPVGQVVSAQASEIEQTLDELLGHDVTTFDGTGWSSWSNAAKNADVIVIPLLTSLPVLSDGAIYELRKFVGDGGTVVFTGDYVSHNNSAFINAIFGTALVGKNVAVGSNKTADADGTGYSGGAGALAANNSVVAIDAASLPEYARSLYETVGGDSTVAAFQFGIGQVTFLGWSWDNALPGLGTQDGGWIDVLDRSMSFTDGHPNGTIIMGTKKDDKIVEAVFAKKFAATSHDDVVFAGKGDDKVMTGGGNDALFGSKGKDKLYGENGLDVLSGGAGKDKVWGGDGEDYFLFDVKAKAKNLDKIKDFQDGEDMLLLAQKKFSKLDLGELTANAFNQHIDYTANGTLKYDGKAFAKLASGLDIDHADFLIV